MERAGVTVGTELGDQRFENGDFWVTKPRFHVAKARRIHDIIRLEGIRRYYFHNNNLLNAHRALSERMFLVKTDGVLAPPPQPRRGRIKQALDKFKHKLVSRLPKALPRLTPDSFLNYFSGPKYVRYVRALERLSMLPISRNDAKIKYFVKAEKTIKEGAVPRGISPRSAEYNLSLGVYLKHAEHNIFKAIDGLFGEQTVAKGLNAVERGRLIDAKFRKFSDPVAVGLDASRFDQHVSKQALQWEHSIYQALYPGDRELQRLLSWQLTNVGSFFAPDGVLKFRVTGRRMSGDMNTALGNVLLMCAMMWSYSREVGVNMSLLNDGDDCVVIVERKDYDRFVGRVKQWFHGLGFTMKVEEPVTVLEQIVFCQSQPVWDGSGYRMVRDPRAAIPKDLVTVKPLDTEGQWNYLRAVMADCGLALTDGIPVMPAFYHMMGRGAPSRRRPAVPETGMDFLARGLEFTGLPVSDESRVSFWRAFSIDPASQLLLEEELSAITPSWAAKSPMGETTTNFFHHFLQQ